MKSGQAGMVAFLQQYLIDIGPIENVNLSDDVEQLELSGM
jgi:hypothetical protein